MSTLPQHEQQSIEDILEQIRKEASAHPLTRDVRARHLPHQDGGVYDPAVEHTPHFTSDTSPHQAADADPEWVWNDAETEGVDTRQETSPDLPSMLKRVADNEQSASVHAFPRTPRARLTEALRRVRAPGASTSSGKEPASAPMQKQASQDLARLAPPASPSATAPSTADPTMRREMTSFLDTRFKKLSNSAAESTPANAAQNAPDAASPRTMDAGTAQLQDLIEALARTSPGALSRSQLGAAELLRPMLKQWLMENMPRIVEKALSMEVVENEAKTVRNKIV